MTDPDGLRALVVDDEGPARLRLVEALRASPGIVPPLLAGNGMEAVELIRSQRPQLVFLDVQMPELDGFGVVQAVGAERMPSTIFVTAFDQHAVRAFEANALDYLLKPFSDERFSAALQRAITRMNERDLGEFGRKVLTLMSGRAAPSRVVSRILVKSGTSTRLVFANEIDLIEGAGVYVTLHVGDQEILHRTSLNELEGGLDSAQFLRIHRSTIVNLDRIESIAPLSHGECELTLKGGRRARVSRSYRAAFDARLA